MSSEPSPDLERNSHWRIGGGVESSMITVFCLIWISNINKVLFETPLLWHLKNVQSKFPIPHTIRPDRRTPHFVINSVPKGYLMSNNALRQSVHTMQATGPHTHSWMALFEVFNYWTPGTMQKHPAMQYVSHSQCHCHRTNAVPLCPGIWE